MSRKKKKNPAAEDLIESLMRDLKDSPSTPNEVDGSDLFSNEGSILEDSVAEENFLSPQGHQAEEAPTTINQLWKDIESGISSESASEVPFESPTDEKSFHLPENLSLPKIPLSEIKVETPTAEESFFQGPSAGEGGYQHPDEVFAENDKTNVLSSSEEGTVALPDESFATLGPNGQEVPVAEGTDADKTLAVSGFANAKLGARRPVEPEVKVSVGQLRGSGSRTAGSVFTNIDASLAQADNLKLAQQRLLELENEVEKLREENEELASAGEIIRTRADEYAIRIDNLAKEKAELEESHQSEILILKGNLQYRDSEIAKARIKIDELEARLKSDFKKIRVRERELENRLELVRAEKAALVQSKDDYIMDMKRKIDQLQSELDNYRSKVLELNKTIDSNQEQFKRTVRALRLALSNLEVKEENIVPFKKAE